MAVLTPHFDLPFSLSGDGASCVEQGTARDLSNCVYMICATPLGYRDEVPNFGIEDLTFSPPPVMRERVRASISAQEPRAVILFEEHGTATERLIRVALDTRKNLVA